MGETRARCYFRLLRYRFNNNSNNADYLPAACSKHHSWMQRVLYPPVLSVCASTDALRMIDASASASVKLDALHTCTPTETVKSQVCTLPTCAHPPLFSYP